MYDSACQEQIPPARHEEELPILEETPPAMPEEAPPAFQEQIPPARPELPAAVILPEATVREVVTCGKCEKVVRHKNWIACDKCDKWFHAVCVQLRGLKFEKAKAMAEWYCSTCSM